ncbi:MAG: hypothetical protein AAGK26_10835 [Pseudomonadota bacterium]
MQSPLVFCHYGNAAYLQYTLRCARRTNPDSRLVLLGDDENKATARNAGWEHFDYRDFRSNRQDDFNSVYKPIQGRKHKRLHQFKGKKDWLKFVFERWYHIEGFVTENSFDRFWHFDSDTMILRKLAGYERALSRYDYTTQCNAACLNGYVRTRLLTDYNAHTIGLFEDAQFLDNQQREFDEKYPEYAFTEMRAFFEFTQNTDAKGLHLMTFSADEVFDDALRQKHGFETVNYHKDEFVKDVRFNGDRITGMRDGREIAFVTLNMSWLPILAYRWVFRALNGSKTALAKPLSSKIRRKYGF